MSDARVFGVDFSSAPSTRKPITVADGRLLRRSGSRAVYALDAVYLVPNWDVFQIFLSTQGPWVGGFDLPFGQPRALIEHYGWPTDWSTFVDFFSDAPREQLRSAFKAWCDARPVGDKFAWRAADRPAGSSPAMRWTNPPVAWMMQAGVRRMRDADLLFPAHRSPSWAFDDAGRLTANVGGQARIALEAYPAFTARQVIRSSYKSDDPSKHTPERFAARRQIVRALERGVAGLAVQLELSGEWRDALEAEGSADLLDAVICGLQAAHASLCPGWGLSPAVDPLEGWISTVPHPDTEVE